MLLMLLRCWKTVSFFISTPVNLFELLCMLTLTLETQTIKMGKPMILTCAVHGISKINTNATRQFAKGNNGDPLCFNGYITQTRKYEEILSEGNTFSLKINNVTELDVNTIYQCRYEFSTVKQMIRTNEMNFEYVPTENKTVIEFNEYDNKSFEIRINFTKIFPVPKCFAQTKTSQFDFVNTSVMEERIFYKVSFVLKHYVNGQCGTDLEIFCRVGRSYHYLITFQPFNKCSIMFTCTMLITTTVFIIILLVAIVIVYNKREKPKLCKWYEGKSQCNSTEEESSVAFMSNSGTHENHSKPSDIQLKDGYMFVNGAEGIKNS